MREIRPVQFDEGALETCDSVTRLYALLYRSPWLSPGNAWLIFAARHGPR